MTAGSLDRCGVCGSTTAESVLAVAHSPIHPFRPPGLPPSEAEFGRLEIVRCGGCGHLYNAGFDPARAEELYGAFVLTNTPVSESMINALEETARFILRRIAPDPVVLEIGGGVGALALLLARTSREVHLIEPSRALSPERFAGTGVTLHQAMFPAPTLGDRRFDLVISRQVLEHVPDPGPFLAALRARMADGGYAYIEVPSAEYIRRARSIVDFHYPHVHYYRRGEIEVLFRRAGFAVVETVEVKSGHDVGFLLRAGSSGPETGEAAVRAAPGDDSEFAEAIAARRARGEERLSVLGGAIGLYGANAYSQALLGLYPETRGIKTMFDDTPQYAGQIAYGPQHALEIGPPSRDRLRGLDAVVITAYLHDLAIARKLRGLGFSGAIYTVRSDQEAGRAEVPPSLFL